jgi:hypothetical protein
LQLMGVDLKPSFFILKWPLLLTIAPLSLQPEIKFFLYPSLRRRADIS